MSAAHLRATFDGIELHAPVSMQDLADIRDMVLSQTAPPPGVSVDVTLRGTPDRKHDGAHRVVVHVDDVCVELPVTT